jgi:hypothetical protein
MKEDDAKIVPPDRASDLALQAAAAVANLASAFDATTIPGLGAMIGSVAGAVLGGWAVDRKFDRVVAALDQLRYDFDEAKAGLTEVQRTYLRSDQFAELLEVTLRHVSTEPSQEKREIYGAFLRALVRNPGQWDEARLTSDLIAEIDMPGLVLVTAMAALAGKPMKVVTLSSRPSSRVYEGDLSIGNIIERPEEIATYRDVPFSWPVLEEWTHRLREMRVLGYQSSDARGGFGGVHLTELGFMVARWITAVPAAGNGAGA